MHSLLDRLLLLPSAVLALTTSYATAAALERRDGDNAAVTATNNTNVTPAPLIVTPNGDWDGIDGSWSSFTLRIGIPEQTVRVFLSTASYQTWAVVPQGCQSALDVSTCEYQRGGIYEQNASSSYNPIGIYTLFVDQNLGYNGNAKYGQDTLSIGALGEDGPTIENVTVGGLAVDDFYLGVLGVNPKVSNWTSYNDWTPSLMTQLKEQKHIPSVSFGYTAGAQYRSTGGVLGSLTLGGYDASKFLENNVQFVMAADNDRDLVVAIQSISTPSQIKPSPNPTELLPNPIYAYIDSTVPQIWLPLEACQAFEREFGLVYNNQSELYIVNDTLHDTLIKRNASVTFTLGQSFDDSPTVQITLPYSAFDLTASPPYYGLAENTTYFPLRRAVNDTQYTLGRTFLQEAYLTVDWEGSRFNVSQVNWDQPTTQHIVAIPPFSEQQANWAGNGGNNKNGSSLSGGAIAGVVVGIVVFIAILVGLLIWHIRRNKQYKAAAAARFSEKPSDSRRQSSSGNSSTTALNSSNRNSQRPGQQFTVLPKAELQGSDAQGYYAPNKQNNRNTFLSVTDSSTRAPPGTSWSGDRTPIRSSAFFSQPDSPLDSSNGSNNGEGTHNSNASSSGNGTSLPFSPLMMTPQSASADRRMYFPEGTAESAATPIYEMPGDMPEIREKDGKPLSEKEALAYREKLYNGVDTSPATTAALTRSSPNNSPIDLTSSPIAAPAPAATSSSTRTPIADMFTRPFRNGGPRNWSLPRRVSPAEVVPVTLASADVKRELAQQRQQQQQQQEPQPSASTHGSSSNSSSSTPPTPPTAGASVTNHSLARRGSSWSVTRARPFSFEDQRKIDEEAEEEEAKEQKQGV